MIARAAIAIIARICLLCVVVADDIIDVSLTKGREIEVAEDSSGALLARKAEMVGKGAQLYLETHIYGWLSDWAFRGLPECLSGWGERKQMLVIFQPPPHLWNHKGTQ